jgi:hypothetical protein
MCLAKQTSGRYFWRRCGRMRASPTWLKYSRLPLHIGLQPSFAIGLDLKKSELVVTRFP